MKILKYATIKEKKAEVSLLPFKSYSIRG